MAEALYNKYRPQIFEDVVGQEHIERTLKNAIASDKISHAYMFTGPRGTGKTTTARLLSKALLCEKGPTPDPDGTCEDCELIAAGEHPDVYELDAASRTGVENVREEIIGKVNYAPTRGRYKVYIIDEVHMLSTAAFNALLKTLEEPPDHVVFVLCTTDPQKVPETILSRCQRFDFRRIASEELISRLGAICEMEGVKFEGDALDLIAHRAQGGMRDALTSLDQLIAFGEGEVTTQLAERLLGSLDSSDLADIVRAIGERDAAACFRWTSEYMETGADLVQFVADLTEHMRDMYVMSLAGADVALEVTEAGRRELEVELAWYGSDRLARMLGVLGDLTNELKTSTNQRLSFEIALTRMVRPESDLTLASLAERIEALERGGSASLVGSVAVEPHDVAQREIASSQGLSDDFASSGTRDARPASPATTEGIQVPEGINEGDAQVPEGVAPGLAPANAESNTQDEGVGAGTARTETLASNQQVSRDSSVISSEGGEAAEVEKSFATKGRDYANASTTQDASKLWASVLAHLKKVGPAFGVIFMNTATSIEDGKLTIAFDPSSDFAFKAAQKQDAREALEKALARAGAEGMPYRIVKGDAGASVVTHSANAEPDIRASQASPTTQDFSTSSASADSARNDGKGNVPADSARNDGEGNAPADSARNDVAGASPGPTPKGNQQATPEEGTQVPQGVAPGLAPANAEGNQQDERVGAGIARTETPESDQHVPVISSEGTEGSEVEKSFASEGSDQANGSATNVAEQHNGTSAKASPSNEPQQVPQDAETSDPDFQDFLESAFGEGIVIEEMQE